VVGAVVDGRAESCPRPSLALTTTGEVPSRGVRGVETGVDHLVARLASRRRGVVSRAELLRAGVSARQIERRLAMGRLHRLHRGVYAVGHQALHPQAPLVAALLACGPDPVLGHRTAAELWALLPPAGGPVLVIRAASSPTRRAGIVLHGGGLDAAERTTHQGLPATSPVRTLRDLAASEPRSLERATNEALARRLVRPGELEPVARRRGAAAIRAMLDDGPGFTRSEAERVAVRLVVRAGWRRPETNARIGPWEVDLLWRDERLVVEIDGYAAHTGRSAFERDRRKDAALQALGYTVLRLTYRQLIREPEWVVATLARLLG